MKKRLALLCFCVWLAVGGCATGGREAPRGATPDQNREIYELYRQYMETTNENRRRAGAPLMRIRSYEEWRQSPSAD